MTSVCDGSVISRSNEVNVELSKVELAIHHNVLQVSGAVCGLLWMNMVDSPLRYFAPQIV